MSAKSKSQQRLFQMVKAAQSHPDIYKKMSSQVQKMADSITNKDVKDFADTDTEELPDRVKEESLRSLIQQCIKEILNEKPFYKTRVNEMKDFKLMTILKEANFFEEQEEKTSKLTDEQKQFFLEKISQYNTYGTTIYRKDNLVEIAKELNQIAQFAEAHVLSETEDWYDKITINRNIKTLKALSEEFGKVAKEVQGMQERMFALYEDMGFILNRYYDITDGDLQSKEAPAQPQQAQSPEQKPVEHKLN